MNSYLDMAELVLRRVRRPLSPRFILEEAFRADLVPAHLYGHTQHKTLQARLSEDILFFRQRSRFFRTEPGKFFLREFLDDETIPEQFRQPIKARRRIRELSSGPVLCVHNDAFKELKEGMEEKISWNLNTLFDSGALEYFDVTCIPIEYMKIWSFSMVVKTNSVLSYRMGRYRLSDDTASSKRTVGFSALVSDKDRTLFNMHTFGLYESAVTALSLDLDLPISSEGIDTQALSLQGIEVVRNSNETQSVLVIFEATAPSWFHPTTRRLSINDLRWIPFNVPPNFIDDFDPWSKIIMDRRFSGGNSKTCPVARSLSTTK